jgi:hypothetical protein
MWLWVSFAVSWAVWSLLGVLAWLVLAITFQRPVVAEVVVAVMVGMTPVAILLLFRLALAVFDKEACACRPELWPRMILRTLRRIARHPVESTRGHLVWTRRGARRTS